MKKIGLFIFVIIATNSYAQTEDYQTIINKRQGDTTKHSEQKWDSVRIARRAELGLSTDLKEKKILTAEELQKRSTKQGIASGGVVIVGGGILLVNNLAYEKTYKDIMLSPTPDNLNYLDKHRKVKKVINYTVASTFGVTACVLLISSFVNQKKANEAIYLGKNKTVELNIGTVGTTGEIKLTYNFPIKK